MCSNNCCQEDNNGCSSNNCCDCCKNCCSSFWEMQKIFFLSILPSLMDLTTDILNGLDMIDFHDFFDLLPHSLCGGENSLLSDAFNACKKHKIAKGSEALTRYTIGIISISLVFLPGVVKAIKMTASHVKNRDYLKIPTVIFYIPFPLYIMFRQLTAFCQPNTRHMQKRLLRTLTMEAFYESFPQLVLQTIAIIYNYPSSHIQKISIGCSFLLLTKTTIMIDSQDEDFGISPSASSTAIDDSDKVGCFTSMKKEVYDIPPPVDAFISIFHYI